MELEATALPTEPQPLALYLILEPKNVLNSVTWKAEAGTERECLSSSFPWYGTELMEDVEESLESVLLNM